MIRKAGMLAGIVALIWAATSIAQPGGGPPGGGMGRPRGGFDGMDSGRREAMRGRMEAMRTLNVDAMWAVLCFGVELSPQQLNALDGAFNDAWHRRLDILRQGGDDRDWNAVKDEFQGIRTQLDTKISATLDRNQMKAYDDAMKEIEKAQPRFRGPQ